MQARKGFLKNIAIGLLSVSLMFYKPVMAHAAALSGVDAFMAAITNGCLTSIAKGIPVEAFVRQAGGQMIQEKAAVTFLNGQPGTAYILPHPDHQFVLTSTHEGKACSVFVRRIDRARAEQTLVDALGKTGFIITEPRIEREGLYTTGYAYKRTSQTIGIVTSFSVQSEVDFNAVVTVYRKM